MTARHFNIHSSAAETATFNGPAIVATAPEILVGVDATVVTGTDPTLDIEIEWSLDGVTWISAATPQTFTQLIAVGAEHKRFDSQAKFYRLAYTIGGTDTPTFTFLVVGTHFDRN